MVAVCTGDSVLFDNLSVGEAMIYDWNFGVPEIPNSNEEEPGSRNYPKQDTGAAQVVILLTGENFCGQKMATDTLTLLPVPVANIAISFPQPCERDTVYVNNTSTGSPFQATWTTNLGDTFNTYNPPILTPDFPGDVVSQLIVHLHLQGVCSESDAEDTVTVYASPVTAQFSIFPPEICLGNSFHLAAQSSPGTVSSWELTIGGVTHSFLGNEIDFTPAVPGSLHAKITSAGCGNDTMSLYADVLPPPALDVSFDLARCEGQPVGFQLVTDGSGHELFFDDGASTGLISGQHTFAQSGIYFPHATAQSPLGCTADRTGEIEIYQTPTASILYTDSI
ncbi:MAG: hypothetical protein AAB316_09585, partial [Bacteroidota bacterium]